MDKNEKLPKSFAQKVRAMSGTGGVHLGMCYSCGTCVSRCMIQLKIEPGYNPRRLIRKVMMGLDQDACKDKTTWLCSACDLCYPACPQKIHISEVIGAIKSLAVEAGHTSPLKAAVVNEQICVACGLCVEVCPYEAVTLQPIPIGRTGKERIVAKVNASRCMACGLCAAGCRSASIGLPEEFSNESLIEELWNWVQSSVLEEKGAGEEEK
jgi:heterodisulfide reductase subunit C